MEFNVDLNSTDNKGTNNNFINRTGFYDIEITSAEVRDGRTLWLSYKRLDNNATGILFVQILNKNGTEGFQANILKQLLAVNGIRHAKTEPAVTKTTKSGKQQISEEILALKGRKVTVFVVNRYTKYNNQISENININKVFSYPEHASMREALGDGVLGEDYSIFKSKASLETAYNKVTKEEVDEWIRSKTKRDKSISTHTNAQTDKPEHWEYAHTDEGDVIPF